MEKARNHYKNPDEIHQFTNLPIYKQSYMGYEKSPRSLKNQTEDKAIPSLR